MPLVLTCHAVRLAYFCSRWLVYDNNAGLIFRTMTRLLNATIPFSSPSSKAGDTAAIAEANRKFVRVRRRVPATR